MMIVRVTRTTLARTLGPMRSTLTLHPKCSIGANEHPLSNYRSPSPQLTRLQYPTAEETKMSLNQLVYISQAVRKMSAEELNSILETAKVNNARIDVTGSLFYNGGWFLQVLEGAPDTLAKLYHKIEGDPRHKNSRVLYNEVAKFRTFPRWTMNMTNLDNRQADKFDELLEVIEAAKTDRKIGMASPAVTLLKMFKN